MICLRSLRGGGGGGVGWLSWNSHEDASGPQVSNFQGSPQPPVALSGCNPAKQRRVKPFLTRQREMRVATESKSSRSRLLEFKPCFQTQSVMYGSYLYSQNPSCQIYRDDETMSILRSARDSKWKTPARTYNKGKKERYHHEKLPTFSKPQLLLLQNGDNNTAYLLWDYTESICIKACNRLWQHLVLNKC